MARIRITFTESAAKDLEDIQVWYASQDVPEVGRRLAAEILEQVESLTENPDIGRVVPEFGQEYLRELIRPPFRIVYKRETGKVRILRVWRSERLLNLEDKRIKP